MAAAYAVTMPLNPAPAAQSLPRDAGSDHGILLVNLGSPDDPSPRSVAHFLREFLSDPQVLRMPGPLRALLVNGLIAPLRSRASAMKYRRIWTTEGSPLLVHSRAFLGAFTRALAPGTSVRLAMRYGQPSLSRGLSELREAGARVISVLPLFPQSAAATTGSILDACRRLDGGALRLLPAFHAWPPYLKALADSVRSTWDREPGAELLLSFHGLPAGHLDGPGCRPLEEGGACCREEGASCYRAQCLETARALTRELGAPEGRVHAAFQSRMGPGRWIGPSTRDTLRALPTRGVKRLVVAAPAFVADCLETLEELDLEGRAAFLEAGGESFTYIPCLNSSPAWAAAAAAWAMTAPPWAMTES
ncbi:MAG: ferrochelatase [Spirochaetes bacterium]|nr:ferrochelatase [Spirochaetota bacterium]